MIHLILVLASTFAYANLPAAPLPPGQWYLRPDGGLIHLAEIVAKPEVRVASVTHVFPTTTKKVEYPKFDFVSLSDFSGSNPVNLIARQTEVELNSYDLGLSVSRVKKITAQANDRFLIDTEEHVTRMNPHRKRPDGKLVRQQYVVRANANWKPEVEPIAAKPVTLFATETKAKGKIKITFQFPHCPLDSKLLQVRREDGKESLPAREIRLVGSLSGMHMECAGASASDMQLVYEIEATQKSATILTIAADAPTKILEVMSEN